MTFAPVPLETELAVTQLYTIHYFEYSSSFYFPGERHDFWEFQYVDKGEAEVRTDDGTHRLGRGQIIFHRPNEFHTIRATGRTAPNIVVVSFSSPSPAMQFFERRLLTLTGSEQNLLGLLIGEARRCIASPIDDPYLTRMEKRSDCVFGSQQLIRLYLEQLLITMIRTRTVPPFSPAKSSADGQPHSAAFNQLVLYLGERIRDSLQIDEICHDNLIGRSRLQRLFREEAGCGVMEYFSRMKIESARQLIREGELNFTQISEFLGYSSIHYFSRQFKKLTGMTPSEYTASIKSVYERKV